MYGFGVLRYATQTAGGSWDVVVRLQMAPATYTLSFMITRLSVPGNYSLLNLRVQSLRWDMNSQRALGDVIFVGILMR